MLNKTTLIKEKFPLLKRKGFSGYLIIPMLAVLVLAVFMTNCKKDDYEGEITGVCPLVILTDPADEGINIVGNKRIVATFNEIMDAATINTTTFILMQDSTPIAGVVSPASAKTAIFNFVPASPLAPFTLYTATIKKGVRDPMKSALQEDFVWSFTTQPQISLASNPQLGGATNGGGMFDSGTSITVSAVPNGGKSNSIVLDKDAYKRAAWIPEIAYTFTNWTEGENIVSTSADYTFIVTGNRTLSANFASIIPEHTVSLSSNPLAGGTTSGGGSFESGASVTVEAVSALGYNFTNWTEGANIVSSSAQYSFIITGNRTLVANFASISPQFMISLSSTPPEGGTTTGGGSFASGTLITVSAVTAGVSAFTSYMSERANKRAAWMPAVAYTFTNWTEGENIVSTSADYTFAVTANRDLVANFTATTQQYSVLLSSNPAAGGTAIGEGSFESGASVTIEAVAAVDYTFTNWTEGTNVVSTNVSYSFIVTGNRTLVANFSNSTTPQFSVLLASSPAEGGTTSGEGLFDSGASVTVGAVASVGYTFTKWTEGSNIVSTSVNYNFIITRNRTLVANFSNSTTTQYSVSLSSNPAEGGTTSGGGVYDSGASITVEAVAAVDYTFTNWTEGTNIVSSSATFTFVITENRTLVANFSNSTTPQYTVLLSSNPAEGGTTTGSGLYDSGASVIIEAVAAVDYTFTNWTEGANIVSSSANFTFIITENRTLVANFSNSATPEYTVSLSSNPAEGGTTTGSGLYDSGASVTVEALAAVDYTFTNWTEGANIVSSSANYTFVITENRTLVANFEADIQQYDVVLSSNPTEGGTTSGDGLYDSGASVTVEALAAVDYTFTNWTEGANIVSSSAIFTFIITENRTLVANFEEVILPPSGPPIVELDCTAPFAIIAGSTITSTGPSIINGDVGLSPGTAITGFPPGVINGSLEINTPEAAAAKLCLTAAYIDGQGRVLDAISLPGQLGGLTLTPGLYTNSSTSGISGTGANGILTLDAQGNSNAVWIFQIGSTLTTDPATSIVLAGGAQADNIFWVVGTSATFGTTSVFYGNVLADQSITLNTGAVLNGRALTRIGAVTMAATIINIP